MVYEKCVFSLHTSGKTGIFEEIENLTGWATDHWCIGDDFNVIRRRREINKLGGSRRNTSFFNDLVGEHALLDLPLDGRSYTCSNMQPNPLLCRLDKSLFHLNLKVNLLSSLKLSWLEPCLVILLFYSQYQISNGPINKPPFRVKGFWLPHPDFFSKLTLWWNTMKFPWSSSFILT